MGFQPFCIKPSSFCLCGAIFKVEFKLFAIVTSRGTVVCFFPPQQVYNVLFFSDGSQLSSQSSRVPDPVLVRRSSGHQEQRVHRVLRPGGGHRHLHLWTHVSVQRLRTEAQETDQCVLSDLPETHKGRHKNLQAMKGLEHFLSVQNSVAVVEYLD